MISKTSVIAALVAALLAVYPSAAQMGGDPLAAAVECQPLAIQVHKYFNDRDCVPTQENLQAFLACRCADDFTTLGNNHIQCLQESTSLDNSTKANVLRTHNIYSCICSKPNTTWADQKVFSKCYDEFSPAEGESSNLKEEAVSFIKGELDKEKEVEEAGPKDHKIPVVKVDAPLEEGKEKLKEAEEVVKRAVEKGEEMVEEVKVKAGEVVESVEEKVEKVTEAVKEKAEEVKEAVESVVEKVEEKVAEKVKEVKEEL
ncbi:hypothetical protein HK097_007530 [Rhizophlyctis rosea]|uniref:Uncharacterized protein n=1 Tax=Rhizophlyctis rosea TaxID=64517 RepID=A0AAD5SCZ4_9FUNG|nr:hypothetical protein HK097_007530 [Rhizophlyctis rosea]